jgi:hypothetical protein
MASDASDRATGFAEAACKLLIEYTARLVAQKQEATKMLDRINDHRASIDSDYMRRRFRDEMLDFFESRETYDGLIRKASQWVEHGRSPKPGLELELEVRLADFESMIRSMSRFFETNSM